MQHRSVVSDASLPNGTSVLELVSTECDQRDEGLNSIDDNNKENSNMENLAGGTHRRSKRFRDQ